jgi:hypothetical protein
MSVFDFVCTVLGAIAGRWLIQSALQAGRRDAQLIADAQAQADRVNAANLAQLYERKGWR